MNQVSTGRQVFLGFDPGKYPEGIHMCFIFSDDEERKHVLAKFMESGFGEDDQVAYFVDTMSPAELREHFSAMGVHLPDDDSCLLLSAEETYCPDGAFAVERMLSTLENAYLRCCESGHSGLRVTGEMNWALRGMPGSERLIEYESRVNDVLKKFPVTAICQYDARLFDGATLYRLLTVHPMMIVNGRVVRNPYYIHPEQEARS